MLRAGKPSDWIVAAGRRVAAMLACERGNIAMTFALASVPLVVSVGGLVDYVRATMAHTAMQNALDATSLALSRQTNITTMSSSDMLTFATNYFNANYTDQDAPTVTLTPSYSASGPSVTVGGSASVPMNFLGLVGLPNLTITATSTTIWGESRLRVALVLDNTGSMADSGKMTALKTATHNLLTQLQNAVSVPGDVYVSMIPFVKDVNVGASNYGQSWIRWDLWDAVNGKCSRSRYTTQSACTGAGKTWTPASHSTWNGCVTDRDQNNDTTNVAPSSATAATLFPAEQYSLCPGALMGLSYDWTALGNEVDAMQPNGTTNQAIGLAWGWQSLTQSPFTIPAFDPKYTYKQIIILLSDGLNTQDRWYGDGVNTSTQVDARQQILCANIKAAGVLVYTVQVDTGGDPTSTLLQGCASDPSHFFLLTSASQIITTFQSIGTALSDLRLKN
jgi:Flp pilus assembly protein TadG